MRHLYDKVHLNRTKSHRLALFSNLAAALFHHQKIITTLAKAKHARRFAERMITFARQGDLAARRHVHRYVRDKDAVKKLFDELGPHFRHRDGGYTRIIKLGPRKGDAAPMALLELVGFDDVVIETKSPKKSKSRLQPTKTASDEEFDTTPSDEEQDVKADEEVQDDQTQEDKTDGDAKEDDLDAVDGK